MKYRRLNTEELKELEQEFITFLAANTVTGSDWEKLKASEPERAEQLIGLFSDIVFEKVLTKVNYLEVKVPTDLKTFHFADDKVFLLGLKVTGSTPIDFTQNQSPEQMLKMIKQSNAKVQLYSAEKTYTKLREQEIFDMMEQGALISKDGMLYNTLLELKN